MKVYFTKLAFLLLPLLFNIADNWKVKSSTITFSIKNAGITVDGSFSGLEADIQFNTLKPEEANIKASVNSSSINTGIDLRNTHLKKADYFDVEKYPKITLQSTTIKKTGPISFIGNFKLTIKNVTKEIKLPFTFIKGKDKTEFKGNFSINRLDYNVGSTSLTMADSVTISIIVTVIE